MATAVKYFLIAVPDKAEPGLAHAILEHVEPGASDHTLMLGFDGSLRHEFLGVEMIPLPHEDAHLIRLDGGTWTIQHPLRERGDALGLFSCTATAAHFGEEVWSLAGTFRLVWDVDADEWVLGERVHDVPDGRPA